MLPVLSRCLQFNLRPMAPETVHEHLQRVLPARRGGRRGSLRLLSRAARRSMRDALSLTDQAIAYGAGRLEEAVVRAMLGTVDRSHARALVESLARRDRPDLLATVDTARRRCFAAGTLEELALLLQQMAVEQAVPGALDERDPTRDARATWHWRWRRTRRSWPGPSRSTGAGLAHMSDEYAALTMVLRLFAFPAGEAAPRPARAAAAACTGAAGGGAGGQARRRRVRSATGGGGCAPPL